MFESSESLDARIKSLLEHGEQRIDRTSPSDVTAQLRQSLDDVSSRWDALKRRFTDRRNQLTVASDEARQLNDRLTESMSWLNGVEQALTTLPPVSRVIDNIQLQIQQHHVTLRCFTHLAFYTFATISQCEMRYILCHSSVCRSSVCLCMPMSGSGSTWLGDHLQMNKSSRQVTRSTQPGQYYKYSVSHYYAYARC